jgi:hypothetical protein
MITTVAPREIRAKRQFCSFASTDHVNALPVAYCVQHPDSVVLHHVCFRRQIFETAAVVEIRALEAPRVATVFVRMYYRHLRPEHAGIAVPCAPEQIRRVAMVFVKI